MLIEIITIILLALVLIAILFIAYHFVTRTKIIRGSPSREKARFRRIMEVAIKFNHITNDMVEEITGVSDSTAERDLDNLEKNGYLKQIGKVGRGVHYVSTKKGYGYLKKK